MRAMTLRGLVAAGLLLAPALPALADGDLPALNKTARQIYAEGRASLLAAADPVIVVAFDYLVLHHKGERRQENFTPALYHRLKEVCHLPLALVGALAPVATGAVQDDDWRDDLAELAAAGQAALDDVAALDAPDATKATATKLMLASLEFIQQRRAANAPPDWATVRAFARKVAPWTLALVTTATNAQLDGLHVLTGRWQAELGPDAWSRVYVLVLGSKTPRENNLAMQYFTAALGPGSERSRVIYTEGVFDEAAALGVLGVLLIDRTVGDAFYGEEMRMERDLLGDAATAKVLQLFGKLGAD